MSKRRLIPLSLLGLLALLYLVPQLPAVKGWLFSQASSAIAKQGYRLEADRIGGDPWRALRFDDLTLTGPGLDLSLERLRVGYGLPSLLFGRLPISVDAQALSGDVQVGELAFPGGGGGGLPIRPVLRDVDISGVDLSVNDAPYTLPDLEVQDLGVAETETGLELAGVLATAEGSATFDADLRLSPFTLDARIARADARIARRWWQGVEGGNLSGTVKVGGGDIRADLDLQDGAVSFLDETATGLAGNVTYRHPIVDADLTGELLDGQVNAVGGVDIAARQWRAEATGEVGLSETATWLARGRTPFDISTLPIDGRADVALEATGWRDYAVSGNAQGRGALFERTLEGLEASFAAKPGEISAEANAEFAGGPLSFELSPTDAGFAISLKAEEMALLDDAAINLDLSVQTTADGVAGEVQLGGALPLLGQTLSLDMRGDLGGGAVALEIAGQTTDGLSLRGAAVLNEGAATGNLAASLPESLLGEAADLDLSFDGPLDDLPLTLRLDGSAPLTPSWRGVEVTGDLRGTLEATLSSSELRDIDGQFGPLTLGGALDLGGRAGTLDFALAETPVAGPVEGTLAARNGRLELSPDETVAFMQLETGVIESYGVRLEPLETATTLRFREGVTLTADAPGAFALELSEGQFEAELSNLSLEILSEPFTLTGNVLTGNVAATLNGAAPARFDINLTHPAATLTLTGDSAAAELALQAEPGLALGPVTLEDALRLNGPVSLTPLSAALAGALGEVELAASLDPGAPLRPEVTLSAGGETLALALGERLSAQGSLPLEPLAGALGFEVGGRLEADLIRQAEQYAGSAQLETEVAGVPLFVQVLGEGDRLVLDGKASVAGQDLALSGSLLPELDADIALANYGALSLTPSEDGFTLSGGGTLPEVQTAGFTLPAQGWALDGDTAQSRASLRTDNSVIEASWGEGWTVDASLNERLLGGTADIVLDAAVSLGDENPSGLVAGELRLEGDEAVSFPLRGSLRALELSGQVRAATLAGALGVGTVTPAGDLALSAEAKLLEGLTYDATLTWETASPLTLELTGQGADFSATLGGSGLSGRYENGLTLEADGFALGALLERPTVAATLDGKLGYAPETERWSGTLALNSDAPYPLSARLTAPEGALELDAQLTAFESDLNLRGRLLPETDLSLSGGALNNYLSLDADATLTDAGLRVAGETTFAGLNNEALGLGVPPQNLSFSFTPGGATLLKVQGDTVTLEVADGDLRGSLSLPFSFQKAAHTLSAELGGSLSRPEVGGQIAGEVVTARLAYDGAAQVEAALGLNPWLELPGAVSPLRVTATYDPASGWQAQAETETELQGVGLALRVNATGEGASYTGSAQLRANGETIPLSFSGEGADISTEGALTDFSLDALELAPLSGQLSGQYSFDTANGLRYAATLEADGALSGQPFDVTVTASDETLPTVMGTVAGARLTTEVHGRNTLLFNIDRPVGARALTLAGRLLLADALALEAQGQLGEDALAFTASFTPGASVGSLRASLGAAELVGLYSAAALNLTLNAPAGSLLAQPVGASLEAELLDRGGVMLRHLTLDSTLGGEAAAVALTGTAWPEPDLSGTLALPAYVPDLIALELSSTDSGYALRASEGGLHLTATLGAGFGLERVRLNGEDDLPVGPSPTLKADLAWQPASGFSGEATLALTQNDLQAELSLSGQGHLAALAELRADGEFVGTLSANLSDAPWQDRTLDGRLELNTPLKTLWAGYPGAPLLLSADGPLSGTLDAPQLAATLATSGALELDGSLSASLDGAALALDNETLALAGTLTPEGWTAQLMADDSDLSDLIPQLRTPRLSGVTEGTQRWGDAPVIRSEALELRTPESSLRAELVYSEALVGTLETSLDLRDLQLGPELQGQVEGPLTLSGEPSNPQLSGVLRASSLRLVDQDAALAGNVQVSGSLRDPVLELLLAGEGAASGVLNAQLAPARQSYALETDLRVGALDSDAALALDGETVTASGTLGYGAFRVALEAAEDNTIRLEGLDGLEGLSARLDVPNRHLDARGSLSDFSPQARGGFSLRAALANGVPQLSGSLAGVELGPISLGDIALNTQVLQGQARLRLIGERLNAAVALSPELNWQLDEAVLPLQDNLSVRLEGRGTRDSAALDSLLTLTLAEETIALPVAVSYEEGRLALESDAALLDGSFELNISATPAEGWDGSLKLKEAAFAGATLTLDASLGGDFGAPALTATTRAALAGAELSGVLQASPERLRLEQALSAPQLERPVNISGHLFPEPAIVISDAPGNALSLTQTQDAARPLAARGRFETAVSGARLALTAAPDPDSWLGLTLGLDPFAGFALSTQFPAAPFDSWVPKLLDEGLTLKGEAETDGTLVIMPETVSLAVNALSWKTGAGTLTLDGALRAGPQPSADLQGQWQAALQEAAADTPGYLTALPSLPFELIYEDETLSLNSTSDLGELRARANLGTRRASLESNLSFADAVAVADLRFNPSLGLRGRLDLDNFTVFDSEATGALVIHSDLDIDPVQAVGSARIQLGNGSLSANGEFGLARILPAALAPAGGTTTRANLRIDGLNLESLPLIGRRAPFLNAPVNGVVQLRGESITGRLISGLSISDNALPLDLEFNGVYGDLSARGFLGDTQLSLGYEDRRFEGLIRLEQFPLETLAEAAAGETGIEATVTGALRFALPLGNLGSSDVRIATERVRIVGEDSVTLGNVSANYYRGRFELEEARFFEAGEDATQGGWRASGVAAPDILDFSLSAEDADFTPLLSLAPNFAAFGIGAQGSLTLSASGSLRAPVVSLTSPGLDVNVGSSTYELTDLDASLQNSALETSANLRAVTPLTGELALSGGGQLTLLPSFQPDLRFDFAGDLSVPVLGEIEAIDGAVTVTGAEGPQLALEGRLGQPFSVTGDLQPLDLQASGRNLNISAPRFFLGSSQSNVNLRLRLDPVANRFSVSGEVFARQAQLALAERRNETVTTTQTQRQRNPLFERIVFENISVEAPQQVRFNENIGNAELSIDTVLSGTVAAPELSGQARALRGSFNFSGRSFTIDRGLATFERSRGIFPTLDIEARTTYEKSRALSGPAAERFSFVEPQGSTFEVFLNLSGEITPTRTGPRPFEVDLDPTLTSNALIQENGEAPRALSQDELVSLLALGRIELNSNFVGAGGLAGSVAQNALDTAVDYFVLSELQGVLSEALGVDVVEIRTTALSSLLEGDDFGVSLRLGGYISEDLFASYRIGSFDDADANYALTNEFSLRYDLSPLEVALTGRVNFSNEAQLETDTEFSIGVGYSVTNLINLETGIDLSNQRQSARFGVSFRW